MTKARSLSESVAGALAACVLVVPGAPDSAVAADRFPRLVPVKCGSWYCGTMMISGYRKFRDGDATPVYERNGASIRGWFRSAIGAGVEFHYLQVLTRFEADDFRWVRDPSVPLPVRYVDPPPLGERRLEADAYGNFFEKNQPFDTLPWFDEGDFPAFVDNPRAFLASARRHGSVSMRFETWLVCVIDSRTGPDERSASDDHYEVAALVGWKWGFDIAYQDVGRIGEDELVDYTYALQPFEFVTTPTEDFRTGLGTTVGAKVTDRFDIRFGDSQRCLKPGQ
ncbi:MAG: hypothetical protein GC151_19075 [Betaproteobacteria bacterium]|nr:hypothetical protein [Betaproteobacteria bacterium]